MPNTEMWNWESWLKVKVRKIFKQLKSAIKVVTLLSKSIIKWLTGICQLSETQKLEYFLLKFRALNNVLKYDKVPLLLSKLSNNMLY